MVLALIFAVALAVTAILQLQPQDSRLLPEYFGAAAPWLRAGLWATPVLACAAGFVHLRRRTRSAAPRGMAAGWPAFRAFGEVLFVVVVVHHFFLQPFHVAVFFTVVALGGGAYCAAILIGAALLPRIRPPRALARVLDVAIVNAALLLVGGELVLRAYAAIAPSPLLARSASDPPDVIEAHRYRPGQLRYGFPCNELGEYDEPFGGPRVPGTRRIAVIGDSFSAGVVPHWFHYTTVCERLLGAAEVENVGVPAIGPREYLHLLRTEVVPRAPDAVVIALFVGNDLTFHQGLMRSWLMQENVLIDQVPRRLLALRRERLAMDGRAAQPQDETKFDRHQQQDVETLKELFPWVADPKREQPAFSERAFADLEAFRARIACNLTDDELDPLVDALIEMRAVAGATPLYVMLIPDEFQVEDRLFERLENAKEIRDAGRWEAQALVSRRCDALGIPVLDLLPALRAVPALQDGDRHLYHLRDTHFNARGNAVAGKALAEFLRERLKPS